MRHCLDPVSWEYPSTYIHALERELYIYISAEYNIVISTNIPKKKKKKNIISIHTRAHSHTNIYIYLKKKSIFILLVCMIYHIYACKRDFIILTGEYHASNVEFQPFSDVVIYHRKTSTWSHLETYDSLEGGSKPTNGYGSHLGVVIKGKIYTFQVYWIIPEILNK
jgi:hypothetical protein